MCAIFGIVGATLPEKKVILRARDTMLHRGPDDCGLYYEPKDGVTLAHRRLSIIDLTGAGKQPFFSSDERYVIVYNGELYNYRELKGELGDRYSFKTETDTEVLLAAYITWGKQSLEKFNGMFSFVIWDTKEKKLFAARDRVGIKPFFYIQHRNSFYFASEIKALLALNVLEREPNEGIIFDYLYHSFYDHSEETFFKGIKKLPAGHYLTWERGKISIKTYWGLDLISPPEYSKSKNDIVRAFRELVGDAIKLQFRSDVPVGINLSSGLDSNTLLYYSRIVVGEDVHAFSRCLKSEEFNECSVIQEYISEEQKKLWHVSYLAPEEVFSIAETLNKTESEPYGGVLTIANAKMTKLAKKEGITVLLEGQGLDELLAGYKYYEIDYEKDVRDGYTGEHPVRGKENKQERDSINYGHDLSRVTDQSILSESFCERFQARELHFKQPFSSHLLNSQYRDFAHTKIPRVLRFNDHVTMKEGRELRVPFLDHRIVEYCFFLPHEYKIKGDMRKVLVRMSMENDLPHIVKSRQKKAYGAIQVEWFRNFLKDEILHILNSKSFRSRPYWDHKALGEKAERFFKGEGDNAFFLWQCVNLEMWFREFIDR